MSATPSMLDAIADRRRCPILKTWPSLLFLAVLVSGLTVAVAISTGDPDTALALTQVTADDYDGDGYSNVDEWTLGKSPAAYCAIMRADVDSSRTVTIGDLATVASQFLQSIPPANARYNQNTDTTITIADLALMASHFLQNVSACPGTQSTPNQGSFPCTDGLSTSNLAGAIANPGDTIVYRFRLTGGPCVNDFDSTNVTLSPGLLYDVVTNLNSRLFQAGPISEGSGFYSDDTDAYIRVYGTEVATGSFAMTVHW